MNLDLIDINDTNIIQQLCMKYKEVFEKEKANQEESKEDQSLKIKFDNINTIEEQIYEMTTIKEMKLTSEIERNKMN